ncbi:hypothetical protein [Clostridioides difficile]|nr:hypothetical protein [Clostridioides difficile]
MSASVSTVQNKFLVHKALFFILNQLYFRHFSNEKEAYLYFETASFY